MIALTNTAGIPDPDLIFLIPAPFAVVQLLRPDTLLTALHSSQFSSIFTDVNVLSQCFICLLAIFRKNYGRPV
jgi:hypothetical protein